MEIFKTIKCWDAQQHQYIINEKDPVWESEIDVNILFNKGYWARVEFDNGLSLSANNEADFLPEVKGGKPTLVYWFKGERPSTEFFNIWDNK